MSAIRRVWVHVVCNRMDISFAWFPIQYHKSPIDAYAYNNDKRKKFVSLFINVMIVLFASSEILSIPCTIACIAFNANTTAVAIRWSGQSDTTYKPLRRVFYTSHCKNWREKKKTEAHKRTAATYALLLDHYTCMRCRKLPKIIIIIKLWAMSLWVYEEASTHGFNYRKCCHSFGVCCVRISRNKSGVLIKLVYLLNS